MRQTDQLQQIIDRRGAEGLYVEHRPFRGWFLCSDKPRYFFDEGDHLGDNFTEAYASLVGLAHDLPLNRRLAVIALRDELADITSKRMRHKRGAIEQALSAMPYEELSYWSAKCDQNGSEGRRAAKALRVLLGVAS